MAGCTFRSSGRIFPMHSPGSLPVLGAQLIGAFAAGDALAGAIPAITAEAFDFPARCAR